ncbi:MAG: hypothetical protein M3X11_18970, partial [Acidobacteriota bacterium]|nr:hypothetical protein [Acidobacteriota bacterium]
AILWGGLIAGVLDILAAFVTNAPRGVTPMRLLHAVASGVLGRDASTGGITTAILGLALHFVIAFGAAAVYYAVSRKLTILVRQPIICGLLFGIAVYWFMNLIVLPLSAFPYKISYQLSAVATGLMVHMLCVGLPIALAVRRYTK